MIKDQFKKISPTNEIDTSGTYNIHIQQYTTKNIQKQEKNGKNGATSSEKF